MKRASFVYTKSGNMRMPGNMATMSRNGYMQYMKAVRKAKAEHGIGQRKEETAVK